MFYILHWFYIFSCKFLACTDDSNCLSDGKEVLIKYGYISTELNFNLLILASIGIIANILSYFGILRKMKKQPAYWHFWELNKILYVKNI